METIEAAFVADPLIDEFGVVFMPEAVPSASTKPRSDGGAPDTTVPAASEATAVAHPAVVHDGHKLGLAQYAALPLYRHAHSVFLHARTNQGRRNVEADQECDGHSTSDSEVASAAIVHALGASSRVLCLLNAYFHTGWNERRRLVRAGTLTTASELSFASVALTVHPKSDAVWRYRRWLLRADGEATGGPGRIGLLEHELAVCTAAANRYPKLYCAWGHRQWVLAELASTGEVALPGLIAAELAAVTAWTARNVQDYSALHYSTICATHPDNSEPLAAIIAALETAASRAETYPGSDAIWCQARVLLAEAANRGWAKNVAAARTRLFSLEHQGHHPTTAALWLGIKLAERVPGADERQRALAEDASRACPGNPLFQALAAKGT